MWPNSNDFASIIGIKEKDHLKKLSKSILDETRKKMSLLDLKPGKNASDLAHKKLEDREYPDKDLDQSMKNSTQQVEY